MHLVRKLWSGLVLTVAGTTLLIGGSGTFVIGAFIGGLAAMLGGGFISLITGTKVLDAYISNVITWLGILIGGGLAVLRFFQRYAPTRSDVHGSARLASPRETKTALRASRSGLSVGREIKPNGKPGQLLRDKGPAHLLSLAPTRSGKGVGAIIPNLLTADRSTVCTDPKGENTRAAYQARSRVGPVHVLNPFGITGLSAAYNPLDGLEPFARSVTTLVGLTGSGPALRQPFSIVPGRLRGWG
jgi:type IV secretion system protein VirD4